MPGFMFFAAGASPKQARVILNAYTSYEVQVDGRTYNSQGSYTINDLRYGTHTVAVYQVTGGGILGIGKKRNLITSQNFSLNNNDVIIDVSQNGQLRISQHGAYGNTNRDKNGAFGGNEYPNRNDSYGNNNRDRNGSNANDDCNKNGNYGNSHEKGNGNKYGHHKNKSKTEQGKNNQGYGTNRVQQNDRWGNRN